MKDYTKDQIGKIITKPINNKTKDQYTLLIVQPKSNEQIVVIEPCDWAMGRERVINMIDKGVNPFDIRFCFRPLGTSATDGLPLLPINQALWWTKYDQIKKDKALKNEKIQ